MTTKIAIFGVGLIGGSLAFALKASRGLPSWYAHRPASADKYISRGVVDQATLSIEEAALDADFIFLCVPVGNLDEYLTKLSALPLKKGCIITDVGSTKASIALAAEKLALEDVYFIGGHPMAGSERSGVEAATPLLFENAYYVLTPPPGLPEEVYDSLVPSQLHAGADRKSRSRGA